MVTRWKGREGTNSRQGREAGKSAIDATLASAKAMCYNNAINANAWKTNDKTAGELTRQKP